MMQNDDHESGELKSDADQKAEGAIAGANLKA
jgi:hypothetical protein